MSIRKRSPSRAGVEIERSVAILDVYHRQKL
jgi:hypothetical protein